MNYLQQIKKQNEEILKFLIKNKDDLKGHQLSMWDRKEYKDVNSLVRELIKQSKNPANEFKIGLLNKKFRSMSYDYKKRSDMEKLLKSGNLGDIDIEITDIDQKANAIKQFGTSS